MSPPEVWGPAVWSLFHTLIEKINERYYVNVSSNLFLLIIRICKFLPCPDCSNDSTKFLAKVKFSDLKTKNDLKNTLYLFHNWVNNKKRKPLFNYSNLEIYGKYNLINVINNFIVKYQTKGNMKLLTESFQRDIIIKDLKSWFLNSIRIFIPVVNVPRVIQNVTEEIVQDVTDTVVEEDVVEEAVVEEAVVEEDVVEEVVVEEAVVEEAVVEEVVVEEVVVTDNVVTDNVVEEAVVEEVVVEETVVEEVVVEEVVIEDVKPSIKPKSKKKNKKTK